MRLVKMKSFPIQHNKFTISYHNGFFTPCYLDLITDKGTLLHTVCRKEPNGFDGWIYGDCCVCDAQTSGERG